MHRRRRREQDAAITAVVVFIAAALVFSFIVSYWETIIFWLFITVLAATLVLALTLLFKGRSRW